MSKAKKKYMTIDTFLKKLAATRKYLDWTVSGDGTIRSTLKPVLFQIALKTGPKVNGDLAEALVERAQAELANQNFCPLSAGAYVLKGKLIDVDEVRGDAVGMSQADGFKIIQAADNINGVEQDFAFLDKEEERDWRNEHREEIALRKRLLKAVGLKEVEA